MGSRRSHDATMGETIIMSDAAELSLREGRFETAEPAYRQYIEQAPDDVRALLNYGGILNELCRFDEAVAVLVRAVSLDPQRCAAWSNLGTAMLELQRYDDAIATFSNAIRIDPSHVPALSGLGVTLRRRGLPVQALAFFDLALALEPEDAEHHHHRALALIAAGDYPRGFAEYEWRWRTRAKSQHQIEGKRWLGENFMGQTLLVHEDGGLGDMLQFARYLPLVKARGGRTVLRVPQPLVSLLSRSPGVDAVIALDDPPASFDLVCPILSLAHVFGTTVETIPSPGGYLSPDPEAVAVWRDRLADDAIRIGHEPALRIGLVWAGGTRPWQREASLWERRRSTGLATLAPLAGASPDTVFYSLQIGEAGREAAAPPSGMCLIDPTNEIHSFDDTAALVSLLDLVIAVDTSTAHLAAALGRPVWLLSRYDQCWRWLVGQETSPWYDTMRLYQQATPFDWTSPVERMAKDLAGFVRIP